MAGFQPKHLLTALTSPKGAELASSGKIAARKTWDCLMFKHPAPFVLLHVVSRLLFQGEYCAGDSHSGEGKHTDSLLCIGSSATFYVQQ